MPLDRVEHSKCYKHSEPPHVDDTIEITMSQPRLNIFSLPPEIRQSIYRFALTNKRREGGPRARGAPGIMVQYDIIIGSQNSPTNRTMAPALVRASKQIHRETIPILYSENEFRVDRARVFLEWLHQIGPVNIRYLKSLRLFPNAIYSDTGDTFGQHRDSDHSGPTWCELLNRLTDEATGLGYVEVFLDANEVMGYYGAGRDLNFVRALGRMRVSKRMEISGCFGTEWPRYLEEKLGMPVWNAQARTQCDLRRLREYQRRTELPIVSR